MIKNYYRPDSIEEAIGLLTDPELFAIPLGGGVVVSKIKDRDLNVVDLQNLPIAYSHFSQNKMHLGSNLKLEPLKNTPELIDELKTLIEHECSYNLRQQASLAGTLLTSDGRSPVACAFLALNAHFIWLPSHQEESLEEYFVSRRKSDALISEIVFEQPVSFHYDFVARTPFDRPIIQVARVQWAAGRTRVVVGGWGSSPEVAYDSQKGGSLNTGLQMALIKSDDVWASKEYRFDVVKHLLDRFPILPA